MSEARAWGWVASLRDGGTTPWSAWATEADRTGRLLPGAQQLEVLRRVNLAAAAAGRRADPTLVERVLTASAPGRGRPDLELRGAVPPAAYGPPPVDPAELPADELLRVATNLLAEDLVATGVPPLPRPRWRRPGPSYRVAGTPWPAEAVREEMLRRGRPPGPRPGVVAVLGHDVATMTELAYVARAFAEGGPSWADWVRHAAAGPRPAPRADLVAMARAWGERVGPGRVTVVLDHAGLPRLLGTRRALSEPVVPSADVTDLARRTSEPLGLLVLPDAQSALLRRTLLPRVADRPGPPLRLDEAGLAWARETGDRVRREVEAADYAVVGNPERLVPTRGPDEVGTGPDDDRVLALAIDLLVEGPR
ncbi:hypothetical protein [Nocardioides rubriscoriae]|uniref:hypothetical protein n=1 Tax=Nocardioides rubriscoriae TaxID=642762 RepID=UPI0011DF6B76|nr:hypothetical protein [Nocardioides rubriscoriae]